MFYIYIYNIVARDSIYIQMKFNSQKIFTNNSEKLIIVSIYKIEKIAYIYKRK